MIERAREHLRTARKVCSVCHTPQRLLAFPRSAGGVLGRSDICARCWEKPPVPTAWPRRKRDKRGQVKLIKDWTQEEVEFALRQMDEADRRAGIPVGD